MSTMSMQQQRWTAITVPKSGEFQTLYKRLEKMLREESVIPITGRGRIPMHVVCTVAMKYMIEHRAAGRAH